MTDDQIAERMLEAARRDMSAAKDAGWYEITWSSNPGNKKDIELRDKAIELLRRHDRMKTTSISRRLCVCHGKAYRALLDLETRGMIRSRRAFIDGHSHAVWELVTP